MYKVSCNSPMLLEVNGMYYEVPCRWCMGCRIDRRNLWNMRLRGEMQTQQKLGFRSSFVTLTYDDNHYKGGVCKKDITDFIKRLREHISRSKDIRCNPKFKYYICSELGENTQRGHYHCCFLGLESEYIKPLVRKTWRFGFTDVSALIPQRISYTLKYMDKQQFGSSSKHELDEIIREPFSMCSKGIGKDFLLKERDNALENGVIWSSGHYVKFPSYYAKKLGVDTEVLKVRMKELVEKQAKKNNMSVRDFTLKSRVINEEQWSTRSTDSGHTVDRSHLRTAKSYIEKSSDEGITLAKELNYENE